MIQELFEKALNVNAPWYVKELNFDPNSKRLDIYVDFRRGSTFNYYDKDNSVELVDLKAYDTTTKRWRHLNFFEHECYIEARVPRVKLPNGKVKIIKTPWEGLSNGFTLLFEALIVQLSMSMPINQVSKLIGVHNDKLWSVLDKYIRGVRKREDFSNIDSIGIDETSRAKGHEYITLFVDLNKRRTLFVTDGKSSKTIKDFTKDLKEHNGNKESIKQVSCDMSPAFIKGVNENMPNANITFDKFHVIKLINEAVDRVRRDELKSNKLLKGTKYIWLKNEVNLTIKQKELLEQLTISKMNIKTIRAYNIKKSYQDIYEAKDKKEFITYLNKWYYWATHSRLEPIKSVAYTIKRHWSGIVNWFETKINNGILEGLNSVIQAAKAKARGYKTFKNYKIIVYLLTGKFDFSIVNKNIRRSYNGVTH